MRENFVIHKQVVLTCIGTVDRRAPSPTNFENEKLLVASVNASTSRIFRKAALKARKGKPSHPVSQIQSL